MTNQFIKALLGIFLGIITALLIGLASSYSTKEEYEFTTNYEAIGHEKLKIAFTRGRLKMQFFAYNNDDNIIISKQYHGYFLRYGSHYLVVSKEQNTAAQNQHLTTKSFFINTVNNDAIFISDQRGIFITKDNKVLHLNSVLAGKRL
ncbi:hypothetical protein [Photobacterium minamisatsumaniensis]|uniref:hypothetical protein n=1 Tax=Photobacterium minamisatsumaniensis TaxID=2910233 RepID=UPI003D127A7B